MSIKQTYVVCSLILILSSWGIVATAGDPTLPVPYPGSPEYLAYDCPPTPVEVRNAGSMSVLAQQMLADIEGERSHPDGSAAPPLPENYDRLLAYAQQHYAQGVDCEEAIAEYCHAVAQIPELPYTETVTMFTTLAKGESHGRSDARNPSSGCAGKLQCHPNHRASMRACGLDFDVEQDRIDYCAMMVAARAYSNPGGFSRWFTAWVPKTRIPAYRDYLLLTDGLQ